MQLRLGLNELEKLGAVPFVALTGLIGGVLQSLGDFTQNHAGERLLAFVIMNAAAVLLWWVSVRRRRWSVWSVAFQIAVALTLAQFVSLALVIPRAIPANVRLHWLDVSQQVVYAQLVLGPLHFLVAAVLVALGRLLPASGHAHAERPVAAADEGG